MVRETNQLTQRYAMLEVPKWIAEPRFPLLLEHWERLPVQRSEDMCLQVWEADQRSSEEMNSPYGRCDCPEFTLEWAADPSNLRILVQSVVLSPEDPDKGVPYRLPVSPFNAWERLNDVTTSSLPASRARVLSGGLRKTVVASERSI